MTTMTSTAPRTFAYLDDLRVRLLQEGVRSIADTPPSGSVRPGVLFPLMEPYAEANFEDDRGRQRQVNMRSVAVFPAPNLRLFVAWQHSSVVVPMTPNQCLELAAELVRAAAEAASA
ncbi:MAG: hypothetical protein KQH57_07340 [Actinomycetales bacterium]|nr:hypothetical protein [Actinomycetales bacterium]